jgi:HSP20 family molecular chaperone IbpA
MEETKELRKREAEVQEGMERTRTGRVFTPAVDIIEKKDDIIVIADMPGVDRESVDINLENNVLTIYGKVGIENPADHRLITSEYGTGDYQRVFTLSDEVDRDNIKATVRNGVLKLVLPKTEKVRSRRIMVESE